MNGHTTLLIQAWKDEAAKLTAGRYSLIEEFFRLKEEIKSVEVLKRTAIKLMGEATPDRNAAKVQGMEL